MKSTFFSMNMSAKNCDFYQQKIDKYLDVSQLIFQWSTDEMNDFYEWTIHEFHQYNSTSDRRNQRFFARTDYRNSWFFQTDWLKKNSDILLWLTEEIHIFLIAIHCWNFIFLTMDNWQILQYNSTINWWNQPCFAQLTKEISLFTTWDRQNVWFVSVTD